MTPAEGLAWIEDGIANWGANGAILAVPYYLALKAEALYLAHRASEALGAIGEAETLVERSGERWCWAELHRLRGVFLTAMGAAETQIETSFCEAIRIAKEQKSVSLTKETRRVTCAKYRRQKESASGGRGFRLADFLQRPAMVPRSHGPQVKIPKVHRPEGPRDRKTKWTRLIRRLAGLLLAAELLASSRHRLSTASREALLNSYVSLVLSPPQ